MDVEAPPPFAGALDGPPDINDDLRLTISDDDEESYEDDSYIPTDIPLPSPNTIVKSNPVAPSELEIDCPSGDSTQKSEVLSARISSDDVLISNGIVTEESSELTSDREEVPNESCIDRTVENEEVDSKSEGDCPTQPSASTSDVPQEEEMEDDDFGDFADFEQAASVYGNVNIATPIENSDSQKKGDDDDDWGDFDSAPRLSRQPSLVENVPSESVDEDDDWAAFAEAAPPAKTEGADASDSPWTVEFDDFATAPQPSQVKEVAVEAVPCLDDLLNEGELWNISSEEEESCDQQEAGCISDFFDDDSLRSDTQLFPTGTADLWLALRVVEEAVALTYQWKTAQFHDNLLEVLRIDVKAVGRGSLPPLDTDAVLKPTPLNCTTSSRRSVVLSPGGSTAQLQPTSSSSNSDTGSPETDPNPVSHPGVTSSSEIDSLSVPPADFNWEDSGLTNPLRGASRSSALLDVDFLSVNSSGPSSNISTLQKELDDLGLSSPVSKTSMAKPASHPSLLDTIMSTAAAQQKKYRPVSELSLDARALHDQLPDIEYLRASMIMFPMGDPRQ